jgi:hypothetical protein
VVNRKRREYQVLHIKVSICNLIRVQKKRKKVIKKKKFPKEVKPSFNRIFLRQTHKRVKKKLKTSILIFSYIHTNPRRVKKRDKKQQVEKRIRTREREKEETEEENVNTSLANFY